MDYILRYTEALEVYSEDYDASEDLNNCIDYVLLNWRHLKPGHKNPHAVLLNKCVNILCPKNNCVMVTLNHAGETEFYWYVCVVKSLHTLAMANLFAEITIYQVNKVTGSVETKCTETLQYK